MPIDPSLRIWPGTAYPLGATYDGSGTNFALFSEVADQVDVCLFDDSPDGDGVVETRIRLLGLAQKLPIGTPRDGDSCRTVVCSCPPGTGHHSTATRRP